MRREFSTKVKVAAFERAKGHCESCTARLFVGKFHYDHRLAAAMGGEPTLDNCKVLCLACHGAKTAASDIPDIARAKRREAKHKGAYRSAYPMQGSRASKWKKPFNGPAVLR